MAELTVGDRLFESDQPDDQKSAIEIAIEYETRQGGQTITHLTIDDAESQGELEQRHVRQAIAEWIRATETVRQVRSVSIRNVETLQRWTPVSPISTDRPAGDVPTTEYKFGDLIVYYVGGKDSSVYGYTSEAIVQRAPPIARQHAPDLTDKIEIHPGERQGEDAPVGPEDHSFSPGPSGICRFPSRRTGRGRSGPFKYYHRYVPATWSSVTSVVR